MYSSGDHFGHLLLAPGALGGVVHHLGYLLHGPPQPLGGIQHLADQAALAFQEAVETTGQVTQLILTRIVQAVAEITRSTANLNQCGGNAADRPHQATRQQYHQQQ
ncbi:hypothetical protein D9M68_914800 [compost metagenome]